MATTITITINPGTTPTIETSSPAPVPVPSNCRSFEQVTGIKPAWAASDDFPVLDTARAQIIGRDTVFDETLKNAMLDENQAYRERVRELNREIHDLKYQIRELKREDKKASSS